ncbi:hypothetical protein GOP47_0018703 [Adiantum capillus-veneris]|uniref:Uncharacterized protein n=1 Tax=Adiantum capillus-veneris TaxID=13818 RepID=A0A9D4UDP5_ADICA|nr:hypothetical protein GOP47_0018703 [Adiantum capillus-veneris]
MVSFLCLQTEFFCLQTFDSEQPLKGIASVRAYGTQIIMRDLFNSLVDANHPSYILFVHMSPWIGIRLDFATCMCVTLASLHIIILRHSITPGLADIAQALLTQRDQQLSRLWSVETINAYANQCLCQSNYRS